MNSVPDLIYIVCLFWKEEQQESRRERINFCCELRQGKLLVFSYTDEKQSVRTLLWVQIRDNVVAVSAVEIYLSGIYGTVPEPVSISIESEGKIKMLIVYLWVALSVGGWRINRSEQKKCKVWFAIIYTIGPFVKEDNTAELSGKLRLPPEIFKRKLTWDSSVKRKSAGVGINCINLFHFYFPLAKISLTSLHFQVLSSCSWNPHSSQFPQTEKWRDDIKIVGKWATEERNRERRRRKHDWRDLRRHTRLGFNNTVW